MNIQHLEHLFKIQIFLAIVAPNFEKKMNKKNKVMKKLLIVIIKVIQKKFQKKKKIHQEKEKPKIM